MPVGSWASSGASDVLQVLEQHGVAGRDGRGDGGRRRGTPGHGAADGRDLLVERGAVRHHALDPGGQRQSLRHARQVGPLPAQLERRDIEVEVVHVGEVVEHEAERDAGLLGDRLRRRVGIAVAEQLTQRVGDVAACPLASGDAPVAGGLVGPQGE